MRKARPDAGTVSHSSCSNRAVFDHDPFSWKLALKGDPLHRAHGRDADVFDQVVRACIGTRAPTTVKRATDQAANEGPAGWQSWSHPLACELPRRGHGGRWDRAGRRGCRNIWCHEFQECFSRTWNDDAFCTRMCRSMKCDRNPPSVQNLPAAPKSDS